MGLLSAPGRSIQLRVVPLVSIIFYVLAFFVLTTIKLAQRRTVSLSLPSTRAKRPLPDRVTANSHLCIDMSGINRICLSRRPIDPSLLFSILRRFGRVGPAKLVILCTTHSTHCRSIVAILSALHSIKNSHMTLTALPTSVSLDGPDNGPGHFPTTSPLSPDFSPTVPVFPRSSKIPNSPDRPLTPDLPFGPSRPLSTPPSRTPDPSPLTPDQP